MIITSENFPELGTISSKPQSNEESLDSIYIYEEDSYKPYVLGSDIARNLSKMLLYQIFVFTNS
jgi:hypothetical protein